MDSDTIDTTSSRAKLDGLPIEILSRVFSFVFETYTPRLCIVGYRFERWKATRFPRSAHFIISKKVHLAAQQARLDCFSGVIELDVPWKEPRRLEQPYIRLQSRLNQCLGSRIQRYVYLMGPLSGSRWIPSFIQGVDTRFPVAVEFNIKAIFDLSFWRCVEGVSVSKILSGEIDKELETWLNIKIPEETRTHKRHNMIGFVEYPWSEAPKNVEIYLAAHCACSLPWLSLKVPLDIIFVWKEGWRRHDFRFTPETHIPTIVIDEVIQHLIIDDGGLH